MTWMVTWSNYKYKTQPIETIGDTKEVKTKSRRIGTIVSFSRKVYKFIKFV